MSDEPLSAAEVVARLWRDVDKRQRAGDGRSVPPLGATSRMIHDADLVWLTNHGDASLPELTAHLVPLLITLAERRDELISEVRLLREAMVRESARLEERDDLLHRLLEDRLDDLLRHLEGPR
ncbi:MAG TPA: hypothetical protein VHT75_18860 [Acidimicrobiales bacterium]|jgi:hypothetical protein|nr:hypothetical protein [Acidimicrobiales bacterium]